MIYVVAQFSCILYLLINADFSNIGGATWGLLVIGWVIGGWAVVNMQLKNLNVMPELKTDHQLITHGIYRHIRHPMYTSLITQGLAVVLTNPQISQWLVLVIMMIVLFLKSEKEQKYLTQRFVSYKNYKKNTGRFLPFL